jgi:hypothetical protein
MNSSDIPQTKEELLQQIELSWNELVHCLHIQSEESLTKLIDDQGWSVKDHIIHIAMWDKAALAMLEGESKRKTLDISLEIWQQGEDPINTVLYTRYQEMAFNQVRVTLQQHHEALIAKLNAMSEADFQKPYTDYQPNGTYDGSIIEVIYRDTIEHYNDHVPWIEAILE